MVVPQGLANNLEDLQRALEGLTEATAQEREDAATARDRNDQLQAAINTLQMQMAGTLEVGHCDPSQSLYLLSLEPLPLLGLLAPAGGPRGCLLNLVGRPCLAARVGDVLPKQSMRVAMALFFGLLGAFPIHDSREGTTLTSVSLGTQFTSLLHR